MNADADEAPGVGFGASGVQLHVERFQGLTTAREDQRHVRAHAAAERRARAAARARSRPRHRRRVTSA